MPRALIVKELRETAWIALLGLLAHLFFVTSLMEIKYLPWSPVRTLDYPYAMEYPFLSDSFLVSFIFVSVCLAIVLGFRQSLRELKSGTYLFLLNRPVTRERLIGAKLLVGGGLLLACSAVPILVYAWWAATPGTHASPFEWWMTDAAWRVFLPWPLLYLGSFLSGIRPGRWIGTRLLPVPAAVLLAILVQFVPWWPVFALAVVLLTALLVVNIFFVARTRDYS